MWFDPGLAGLFITSTLLHLGEDIKLLIVSLVVPNKKGIHVVVLVLNGDHCVIVSK
jgi:hypothetical protein